MILQVILSFKSWNLVAMVATIHLISSLIMWKLPNIKENSTPTWAYMRNLEEEARVLKDEEIKFGRKYFWLQMKRWGKQIKALSVCI